MSLLIDFTTFPRAYATNNITGQYYTSTYDIVTVDVTSFPNGYPMLVIGSTWVANSGPNWGASVHWITDQNGNNLSGRAYTRNQPHDIDNNVSQSCVVVKTSSITSLTIKLEHNPESGWNDMSATGWITVS